MAIKYSVVQQKYDITGQNILKFFAKAQASGQTDFASICETISDYKPLNQRSSFCEGYHIVKGASV